MSTTDDPATCPHDADVIVSVPPGSHRAEALVAALGRIHPSWRVEVVWAGDPQLRPSLTDGVEWTDVALEELDLLRVEPAALPWLAALARLRSTGAPQRPTLVLVAGSVAVLDRLDALVPTDARTVFVPHLSGVPEVENTSPGLGELADGGFRSIAAVGFAAADQRSEIVEWLWGRIRGGGEIEVGRHFDQAAAWFPSMLCDEPKIGVSCWRWEVDEPALLIAPNYDAARPWLLDPELAGPPRVSLAVQGRARVLELAAEQLAGRTEPLRLPGGLEVDEDIRDVVRRFPDAPTGPWTRSAAFRSWLDERYWSWILADRPDLRAAFPHPTGEDADAVRAWAGRAAFESDVPLMIDPTVLGGRETVRRTGRRRDGVNLVGYFRHQSGISTIGRRVARILDRQGVPYTTVAWDATESPPIVPEPVCDQRLEFQSSLVFVNGDQFRHLPAAMPELFGPDLTVVGVWFWELETLVDGPPVDASRVDQIWAATSFMAKPFGELGVPVHHVNVPLDEPVSSGRTGSSFAPLAAADGRFVFGVVLDHLSITARKNPIGAIRAFRRAFRPGEGPILVVKTLNAGACWREHEQLLLESVDRDDIVIWDVHLDIGDHLALIGSFDALVSLHRSEGLGLHLAEAMWLGVPVIATRYSGNLDFMDDECALLVDAPLVHVADGGWAYPSSARWADPDLDLAADHMRRLVDDPAEARRLARAGRAKMMSMPGEPEMIDRMAELLGLELPR